MEYSAGAGTRCRDIPWKASKSGLNHVGTPLAKRGGMKFKSTLVVLAVGGALMGVTAPFANWSPLAALLFLSTLMGAFAAHLIENDDSIVNGKVDRRKAA